MKKLIFLAFVLAILTVIGCTKTDSKVTATISNNTYTMVMDVYNGSTYLGEIKAGHSQDFSVDKDTCLDIKKYNLGSYDSTVNACFSETRTETVS
jgi:hypothetical protein